MELHRCKAKLHPCCGSLQEMLAEIKLKFLKWNHFILRRRALHDLIVKHRLPWWTFTQDTFPGRRKTHVQHKMCSGGVLFPSEKTLPQYSCKSFVPHVTSPSAKWVEWFIKVEHVLLVGNTHCKPPSKKKRSFTGHLQQKPQQTFWFQPTAAL